MEEETQTTIVGNNEVDYTEKLKEASKEFSKEFFSSVNRHLHPNYRKQYNVRRWLSCIALFLTMRYTQQTGFDNDLISVYSIIPFIWSVFAWIFWHYAYWSYRGGIIHTFLHSWIHFGAMFEIIWRLLIQNSLVYLWITFIAPFSGLKTWRKAVKHNKILYLENDRFDRWHEE